MEYWAKFKASVSEGAEKASKSAKVQKIRVDINRLRAQQKSLKQQMGVDMYEFLLTGNQNEVQRVFEEYKVQIDEIENNIQDKKSVKRDLRGSKKEFEPEVLSLNDEVNNDHHMDLNPQTYPVQQKPVAAPPAPAVVPGGGPPPGPPAAPMQNNASPPAPPPNVAGPPTFNQPPPNIGGPPPNIGGPPTNEAFNGYDADPSYASQVDPIQDVPLYGGYEDDKI